MEILDLITAEFNIDPLRIYVTGQSMGGFGTWDIIMRYPERFAAAVPVCGGADVNEVTNLGHIAIWNWHCNGDTVIPYADTSAELIQAFANAGTPINYTTLNLNAHDAWSYAWGTDTSTVPPQAGRDTMAWMFSQAIEKPAINHLQVETNHAVITTPVDPWGWRLHYSTSLLIGNWVPVPSAPTISGAEQRWNDPIPEGSGARFYTLTKE